MANWNDLAAEVLLAVLNSCWQSAAIAVTVWLLFRAVRTVNAATRHAVWWVVLCAVLALPALVKSPRPAPVPTSIPGPSAPLVTAAPRNRVVTPASAPVHAVRAGEAPSLLMMLWFVVAFLLLARLIPSYLRLRGLLGRCVPAPDPARARFALWRGIKPGELLVSNEIDSPLACGFRRPKVVLPESLLSEISAAELDHVLLHEIAHLVRRDQWTNLLARIAGAFLALHPVAQWILRNIERERELACDEWVAAATGAPRTYAATLARLFELCRIRRGELLATGMADKASRLGERIETLVEPNYSAQPATSLRRVIVFTAMLLVCVAAGAAVPAWIAFAQTTPPGQSRRALSLPPKSLLAALVACGYADLPVDDIISLRNHGIGADYLSGVTHAGWQKLTTQQLIELHDRGLSPAYLQALLDARFERMNVKDAIDLHAHGVNPTEIGEIHALGFGPFDARQAIDIQTHGLRPEMFRALKESGFTAVTIAEAIEAHNSGLRAANLREAKQYGPALSLRQVIRLKRAGVI